MTADCRVERLCTGCGCAVFDDEHLCPDCAQAPA